MKETNKKRIIFRYSLVIFSLLLFSSLILANLFKTTVMHADEWNAKADSVWRDTTIIQPERGKILADDGTVLAANLYYYIPRIDWGYTGLKDSVFEKDVRALSDSLHEFDETKSAKEWEKELRAAKKKKKSAYRLIGRLVTHSEFERLASFPFLKTSRKILYGERMMRRIKPFGSMAARSIGNVSDPQQRYNILINWQACATSQKDFTDALPTLCDSLNGIFRRTSVEEWNTMLSEGYSKRTNGMVITKRPVEKELLKKLQQYPIFRRSPNMLTTQPVKNDLTGRHGTSGLESALDSLLYGVPARAPKVALNANLVNWGDQAIPGYDITTTINIQLQDIVEEQLYNVLHDCDGKWGTAILMEVATGEIKAISNLDWNERIGDYTEGENHAVLAYEPGSVVKPISMMVALEDGIVSDIDAPIPTGSVWTFDGGFVKEDHGGAAALSPRQIIAYSSNVGMSRIIYSKYHSNPDGYRQRLKQMGFFEEFHTGIAGERQPRFLTLGNKPRDRMALTRMAFGYTTEIPPLHTLAMFNAMANNGKYVRPRLIKMLSREGEPDSIVPVSYVRDQVCSPENAAKMREMLHGVVWDKGGTARVLQDSLVHIAGKTGTAFILENGRYSSGRKRLAFCGFFPYENPKYSCMVLIWNGNVGAARCSGMVLKNVALKMYARGLLGNVSDYTQGNKDANSTAVLSYSTNIDRDEAIRNSAEIRKASRFKKNSSPKSGIPNLVGMNPREAVARLEKMGIVVKCKGAGYVVGQSMAPGTVARPGSSVTLVLSNRANRNSK